MKVKVKVMAIVVGELGTVPKLSEKRLEEGDIRKMIETIPSTVVKIGYNIQKSSVDLGRLAVI